MAKLFFSRLEAEFAAALIILRFGPRAFAQ